MALFRDNGQYNWDNIPVLAYKEEGTHFSGITRRTLFEGCLSLPAELRYFEIAPGGHSTLERHEHLHVVMILRGQGKALIGDRIIDLGAHDLVEIGAHTWHQFRATNNGPFGFLCLVNQERDRPQRPTAEHVATLRLVPAIDSFIIV